jgi:hypothetical protein
MMARTLLPGFYWLFCEKFDDEFDDDYCTKTGQ